MFQLLYVLEMRKSDDFWHIKRAGLYGPTLFISKFNYAAGVNVPSLLHVPARFVKVGCDGQFKNI